MNFFKMQVPAPIAVTERLVIRRLTMDDVADMYTYASKEEVTRYLLWSPHPDKEFTYRYIKYIISEYNKGNY